MLKLGDLQNIWHPGINDFQEGHWLIKIKNINVSIVKWKKGYYNGDYEIWSEDELFHDVERYHSMNKVLARLTELKENK